MWRMNISDKKGQNTAEYAILIALVIAAAVAMQTYVKRGMQGRVHDAVEYSYKGVTKEADWINITSTKASAPGKPETGLSQYEPIELSSKSTQQTVEDYEKTDMAKGGTVTRESRQKTKQAGTDYQKYDY